MRLAANLPRWHALSRTAAVMAGKTYLIRARNTHRNVIDSNVSKMNRSGVQTARMPPDLARRRPPTPSSP
eukprot:8956688-Lingulodinium_polyedra.AAC.1